MSSFRAAPTVGHLNRLKSMFGYVVKMKHATSHFRVTPPDHSQHPTEQYDWEKTFYGNAKEIIAPNCSKPLGPPVTLTTYVDANLCHDMLSGKSVTGIVHFLNKTVIHFYSKNNL